MYLGMNQQTVCFLIYKLCRHQANTAGSFKVLACIIYASGSDKAIKISSQDPRLATPLFLSST